MNIDINLVRSAVTVIGLLLFIALVVWTWGRSRRRAFDEAARLPFAGDAPAAQSDEPAGRAS
jgi:cytochrome c oxidase cbb3-type subunit 4